MTGACCAWARVARGEPRYGQFAPERLCVQVVARAGLDLVIRPGWAIYECGAVHVEGYEIPVVSEEEGKVVPEVRCDLLPVAGLIRPHVLRVEVPARQRGDDGRARPPGFAQYGALGAVPFDDAVLP